MREKQSAYPRKKPFPIKDRGNSMRAFVRTAETSGSHFLTSLRLGSNHLELDYLLQHIAKKIGVSRLPVYTKEMPDIQTLMRGRSGAVFLNGMSAELQETFAASCDEDSVSFGDLQHLRGMIVVLDHEPIASLNPAFLECFTRRLTWPAWKNRRDDHLRLLEEIHRRIEMPRGESKPGYRKKSNALGAILKHPFTGTDEVAECFEEAIERYLATGGTGNLQAHHFFPRLQLEAATPFEETSPLSAAAE